MIRAKSWFLVAAATLAVASCGSDNIEQVRSDLRVIATHEAADGSALLDFGPVAVLDKRVLNVLVENHGRGAARISSIELIGPEGGIFSLGEGYEGRELQAAESVLIPVTFQPGAQEEYEGSFVLRQDDDRAAAATIRLSGEGSTIGRLEFSPQVLDFGVVGEGTQEIRTVTLHSVGTGPLVIDSIELVDSPIEFTFRGSTNPARLPPPEDGFPGGSVDLRIACSPTTATEDADLRGMLRLVTTDPDQREVLIPLQAFVNRAPIAVIETDPGVQLIATPIELDGTSSYDPDGDEPLAFEWRIFDKPFDAEATLSSLTSPTTTLLADTPGTYEIGLDVVDARGLYCLAPGGDTRLPCTRQVISVKSDIDLEIELIWDHGITDLDLHLLEGDAELYSAQDCHSENRTPDFGVFDDPSDDPMMIRDSLKGYGPELIQFAKPSPGKLGVQVVFAKANGSPAPRTEATVRVRVFGVLRAEMTRTLTEPGEIWEVLTIDWPSAELLPIDEVHPVVTP